MKKTLATLEPGKSGLRKTTPYVPSDESVARGKPMRFTHACGDRPLEGYTIKRGIGVGGFGEVYFALSDAGKEVALKRIQRHIDIELRGVSQCLNLKHINLIALWDIRTDANGTGWVVMEYVPGGSLRDVIENHSSGMQLDDVKFWFRGIAAGVRYLHSSGIVHRDLKPGNIFLDEDGQVIKIGDYGLSKLMSCGRRSGQTESVGTFHYMAPEIGRGVYGKEIDLYALGIILFEMLTGCVPFDGESSQEIIMKHLTAEPELHLLQPAFRKLITKSLRKDPDLRYRNVDEMLADFERCCADPLNPAAVVGARAEAKGSEGPGSPATAEPESAPEAGNANQPRGEQAPAAGISVLYIDDDMLEISDHQEMVFGDVQEIVDAVSIDELAPPVDPPDLGDEPIARSVQVQWQRLSDWWNHGNVSTPVKIVILVVLGIVLLVNSSWIVPLGITLAVIYAGYLTVRFAIGKVRGSAQAAAVRKRQLQAVGLAWRQETTGRGWTERGGDLLGSWLLSGLVVVGLTLLAQAVGTSGLEWSSNQWSFFAWLASVAAVSSWALLLLGKSWERRESDPIRRRFALLLTGILVGAISYGLSQLMLVDMSTVGGVEYEFVTDVSASMSGADGNPVLAAHLVFFASLFLIFRWWKQADPLRKTRLSFWALGWCVLGATAINELAGFPFPWMTVMAGVISVSIQISSAWVNRQERGRLAMVLEPAA